MTRSPPSFPNAGAAQQVPRRTGKSGQVSKLEASAPPSNECPAIHRGYSRHANARIVKPVDFVGVSKVISGRHRQVRTSATPSAAMSRHALGKGRRRDYCRIRPIPRDR